MVSPAEKGAERRAAILDVGVEVFHRYGFKKTSMDDIARAAGLSRQGLYLHFPTKELLFKAAVAHLIEGVRAASRAALLVEGADVEARLLRAFEALHGAPTLRASKTHMAELLETAVELLGSVVADMERGFVADVARTLRTAGIADRWKEVGVSAKELAQHLYFVSSGIKHKVALPSEYREEMRAALRIVCRGAPPAQRSAASARATRKSKRGA